MIKSIHNSVQDPDSLVPIAIAFLAYDQFFDAHSRVPGLDPSAYDADLQVMRDTTHTLLANLRKEASATKSTPALNADPDSTASDPDPDPDASAKDATEKAVRELLRAAGGELHNIAALTGGMVAQEVIKVVTKQYIPVDNTCVFDGITSRSAVVRM